MMTGYLISSNFSKMIFSQQKLAETCNFNKKKTLAQMFSCEFYKNFKNNF